MDDKYVNCDLPEDVKTDDLKKTRMSGMANLFGAYATYVGACRSGRNSVDQSKYTEAINECKMIKGISAVQMGTHNTRKGTRSQRKKKRRK